MFSVAARGRGVMVFVDCTVIPFRFRLVDVGLMRFSLGGCVGNYADD